MLLSVFKGACSTTCNNMPIWQFQLKGSDVQKSEDKQLKQSRGDLRVSQLYTFGQSGQNVFHFLAWVVAGNCVPDKCSEERHACAQNVLKQFGLTQTGVDEIRRVYEFIKADKPLSLEAMLNSQESGWWSGTRLFEQWVPLFQDTSGSTPLHNAIIRSNDTVLKFLLDKVCPLVNAH